MVDKKIISIKPFEDLVTEEALKKRKKPLIEKRRGINKKIARINEQLEILDTEEKGVHDKNILNDLTAKQWMKFKKSFFVWDEREKEWDLKKEHPATYPASVAEGFIKFFTKEGMTVLDPMCGTGSTLVACDRINRNGIGVDLNETWVELAGKLTPQQLYCHDSTRLDELSLPDIDYCIFSPPYGNTLHKSKGGVITRHKKRIEDGLAEVYSDDSSDLGNMDESSWLDSMERITDQVHESLKKEGYMTIIIQNEVGVNYSPIAFKLAIRLAKTWELKPERIWCQETKPVTIHGHPKTFVTNNHHHYCLNFRKIRDDINPKNSRGQEIVQELGINKEYGYLYFISKDGDIARVKAKWNS